MEGFLSLGTLENEAEDRKWKDEAWTSGGCGSVHVPRINLSLMLDSH